MTLDRVLDFDKALFRAINSGLEFGILEDVLINFRDAKFWIPLYLFVILFYSIKYKKSGLLVVLVMIVLVLISDQLSSHIIKPWVERVRPCNDESMLNGLIMRVHCGSGYSFTSSHATNHFAFAFANVFFLRSKYSWILWLGFLWAGIISFGQIYVGVHYPVDVTCGALIGICLGILIPYIGNKFIKFNAFK